MDEANIHMLVTGRSSPLRFKRLMITIIYCFICLCLGYISAKTVTAKNNSQQIIILNPETSGINLSPFISFFVDHTKELELEDVIEKKIGWENSLLTIKSQNFFSTNDQQAVIWFRFCVKQISMPNTSQDWYIDFGTPYYQSCKIWLPWPEIKNNQNQIENSYTSYFKVKSLGFEGSEGKKAVMWKMPHQTNELLTVYGRLVTDLPYILPVKLYSPDQYLKSHYLFYFCQGFYFGSMLIIFFLSILLFMIEKEVSYIYYGFFLLTMGLFFMLDKGLLAKPLSYFSYNVLLHVYSLISGIALIFLVMFSRAFLKINDKVPTLYLILKSSLLICFSLVFLSLILPPRYTLIVLDSAGFIFPIIVTIIGLIKWKTGYRPARFFIIALIVSTLGEICRVLTEWRILDYSFIGANALQIGSATEAVLFSLALVDRMFILRQDREQLKLARKKAESDKHDTELKFQAIFDQTFQFISLIDETGHVLKINQTALDYFQTSSDKILDKPFWKTLWWEKSPETWEQLQKKFRSALDGNLVRFEFTLKNRAQSVIFFDCSLKRAGSSGNKNPVLIIAEARDITEIKMIEQRMYRADKMAALGLVLSGVAHEINNPNNFITFNIQVLKDYFEAIKSAVYQTADNEITLQPNKGLSLNQLISNIEKLLDDMAIGSDRITQIVAELKYYIRGQAQETKKLENLNKVVARVETMVGNQIRKMVRNYKIDIADGLPLVPINAGKIEQVIINLLLNAAQASNKTESLVHLSIAQENNANKNKTHIDYVQIVVEDNGVGIPEDIQEKIFDPFFTTKGWNTGTGLGLAISQQIINEHGGSIRVSSIIGEHTKMIVKLPVGNCKDDVHIDC